MIAYARDPETYLPKRSFAERRPVLTISNTLAGQLLEHKAAIRKICAEMRENELARIAKGEVPILHVQRVTVTTVRRRQMLRTDSRYNDL